MNVTTATHKSGPTTDAEFEAFVTYVAQFAYGPREQVIARDANWGRDITLPAKACADNFKGRYVLRALDTVTGFWEVVTSTDSARVAALYYFG